MTTAQPNNPLILGALLLGAYLYLNRKPIAARQSTGGGYGYRPQVVPASAGSGLNQIAVGALNGFVQSVIGSPRNNSSSSVVQQPQVENGYHVIQDATQLPDYVSEGQTSLWVVGNEEDGQYV